MEKNEAEAVRKSDLSDEFTSDDVRLLADIGFLALARGSKRTARQLFNSLLILRPGSEASLVAEASFQLAIGEAQNAVEILRKAEPSDRITALLAVSLMSARQGEEAMKLLEKTVAGNAGSEFSTRIPRELQVEASHS